MLEQAIHDSLVSFTSMCGTELLLKTPDACDTENGKHLLFDLHAYV